MQQRTLASALGMFNDELFRVTAVHRRLIVRGTAGERHALLEVAEHQPTETSEYVQRAKRLQRLLSRLELKRRAPPPVYRAPSKPAVCIPGSLPEQPERRRCLSMDISMFSG